MLEIFFPVSICCLFDKEPVETQTTNHPLLCTETWSQPKRTAIWPVEIEYDKIWDKNEISVETLPGVSLEIKDKITSGLIVYQFGDNDTPFSNPDYFQILVIVVLMVVLLSMWYILLYHFQ